MLCLSDALKSVLQGTVGGCELKKEDYCSDPGSLRYQLLSHQSGRRNSWLLLREAITGAKPTKISGEFQYTCNDFDESVSLHLFDSLERNAERAEGTATD